MKAIFCAFHENDHLIRLVHECTWLDWTIAWSPVDVRTLGHGAEIIVLNNRICTPDMGDAVRTIASDRLKWIHFVTAGIERGLQMGLPTGVPVTNAGGLNAPALAEHAFLLMLGCMRRVRDILNGQASREWRRLPIVGNIRGLEGACVCIVGLGAVGRTLALRLRAFGCHVIAVSREGNDPNVSSVYSRAQLNDAIRLADVVILCTNYERDNARMLGPGAFNAMKSGTIVVNIARGELIDEQCLIDSLASGHVAAAGLDVTAIEPLPTDSLLWDLPQVIISPHVAGGGSGEHGFQRQLELFVDNFRRLQSNEPLRNLVTTSRHEGSS